MKSKAATKLFMIYFGLFIFAAATLPGAESVAWVVGQQTSGNTGPFIGRYNDWLVGNPRSVSSSSGFDLGSDLGGICGALWLPSSFTDTDSYDFNCVATADEITANSGNVGFYVGGLNENGVTIAQCSVTTQAPELCDSDTIVDSSALNCISHLQCQ